MKLASRTILAIVLLLTSFGAMAQTAGPAPRDTLTVELADKSKIIIVTNENTDLSALSSYDFNKMIEDVLDAKSQEGNDVKIIRIEGFNGETYFTDKGLENEPSYIPPAPVGPQPTLQEEDPDHDIYGNRRGRRRNPFKSFSSTTPIIDFGISNWLQDGSFPNADDSPYSVRSWGSWNIALGLGQDVFLSDDFLFRLGVYVSWYNFKFENDNTRLLKSDDKVIFQPDTDPDRNYDKSKLTVAHFNLRFVPAFRVGRWSNLHIGAGAYGGVKIKSYTRANFKENGYEKNERDYDSFFINNWRYGLRGEIGFDWLIFYAEYDLNPMFYSDKGPELHAASVGLNLFFN
ncbi:hypothetical protein FUAX_08630 [Fulvitalea axinellae]|uniref:Outer membrane protein beta-barrel domain-containing protein n=1 Tax=Fulvitalea axinellae TaxID=1182444 RepID=A0AAU9CHW9_9BACT|nr:hypothetical protein FUAX_08630 [Fulvitalea axinellae]